MRCLGWREVPTYPSLLGPCALATLPLIRQCFFVTEDSAADLERQLFLMRKRVESGAHLRHLFLFAVIAIARI